MLANILVQITIYLAPPVNFVQDDIRPLSGEIPQTLENLEILLILHSLSKFLIPIFSFLYIVVYIPFGFQFLTISD